MLVSIGFLSGGPAATAALIYDANADFDAGFAAGTNPNGVWTYGWSSTLTSPLVAYTWHRILPAYPPNQFKAWQDPSNIVNYTPEVYKNALGAYNDGNINIPAGALILHGGGRSTNDFSHVIFTAPAAGIYSLATMFIGRQNNVNGDVHVLYKGASLFQDLIIGDGDSGSFSTTLSLLAGEKIDFVVGLNGGGLHAGSIELRATLSTAGAAVGAPEPSSVVMMGIGGLFLLGCGWRRCGRSR